MATCLPENGVFNLIHSILLSFYSNILFATGSVNIRITKQQWCIGYPLNVNIIS